jgi:hypothetical protein
VLITAFDSKHDVLAELVRRAVAEGHAAAGPWLARPADPAAARALSGQDIPAVAAALTWLGERLYYLAATGTPPFDDQDTLVNTLLHLWTSALYQE